MEDREGKRRERGEERGEGRGEETGREERGDKERGERRRGGGREISTGPRDSWQRTWWHSRQDKHARGNNTQDQMDLLDAAAVLSCQVNRLHEREGGEKEGRRKGDGRGAGVLSPDPPSSPAPHPLPSHPLPFARTRLSLEAISIVLSQLIQLRMVCTHEKVSSYSGYN